MLTTILALATLVLAVFVAWGVVILRDMEERARTLRQDMRVLVGIRQEIAEISANVDEAYSLLVELATADLDVSWGDTDGAYTFEAHERNGAGHD